MDWNKKAVRAALEDIFQDLDYDIYKSLLEDGESDYDFNALTDRFINEYEDADEG